MCWVQSLEVTFPLYLLQEGERVCNKNDCLQDTRWGMLVGDENEQDEEATFEAWFCDKHIDEAERCAAETGASLRGRLARNTNVKKRKL